jgi:hypothetical protein
MPNDRSWQSRLGVSVVCAFVIVVVSTLFVLSLGSSGMNASETTFEVVAAPLAPGWMLVSLTFGKLHAVHEGQIALIPFLSVVLDGFFVFMGWSLFIVIRRRKKSFRDNALT